MLFRVVGGGLERVGGLVGSAFFLGFMSIGLLVWVVGKGRAMGRFLC